jgi:NAD+ synthase (glutamine-hydrolysing)
MIRLALGQINPTVGDLKGNAEKIIRTINEGADAGADIAIFPELVLTGYPPEDLLYNKKFIKAAWSMLGQIAGGATRIPAILGVPHFHENKLYNAAAVIQKGKITDIAHKSELPNYGVFDEKRYFTPTENARPLRIAGVTMAVTICEDIWVPTGHAAEMCAMEDVEIIINLSSSPYHLGKTELRRSTACAWAKRFGKPLVYCNLVGGQDELVFDGGSFICDSAGKITSSAKEFCEDLLIADIETSGAKDAAKPLARLTPSLNYPQNVFEALKLGLRDYMGKNGFSRVLIALSGGIDSALTTYIAASALGPKNVRCITMPSPYSSGGSIEDSKQLAKNLGIKLDIIPISELMKGFDLALMGLFEGSKKGIAEENIQARIRGILAMAVSNKFGDLVITTGNKSEISVGYCTLYGDTAGGFALLKDLLKTGVYDVCRWINTVEGFPKIPATILEKPPSAELRPNQKDSDSLPEYDRLDAILKNYVEDEKDIEEIVTLGYSEREVGLVAKLVGQSEYKRRQSAPGVKISPKAFGKDRRMPITNRYNDWGEVD